MAGNGDGGQIVVEVSGGDVPDGVNNFQDVLDALRRSGMVVRDARQGQAPPQQPPPQPSGGRGLVLDVVVQQLQADVGELKVRVGELRASDADVCAILAKLVERADGVERAVERLGGGSMEERVARIERALSRRTERDYECVAEVPPRWRDRD